MRAVQIDEFGGPEVLQVVDLPKPEPGDGEVLIRVSRAGMNFADTHQRENSYLARYETPMVLGGEVAGTTEDGRRVLAVQLAKPFGAGRVIATASSEEKRELARSLGADAAVDPAVEDLKDALIEANDGAQVDVVLEMSGGRVFDASAEALAPFGRMVTYGIASREQNTVETGRLMRQSRAVVGFWLVHC